MTQLITDIQTTGTNMSECYRAKSSDLKHLSLSKNPPLNLYTGKKGSLDFSHEIKRMSSKASHRAMIHGRSNPKETRFDNLRIPTVRICNVAGPFFNWGSKIFAPHKYIFLYQ